jgi:hypothetical protein
MRWTARADAADRESTGRGAVGMDLFPPGARVVLPGIPALTQGGKRGVNLAWTGMSGELWKCHRAEKRGDCCAGDPQVSGHLVGRDALSGERHDLLKVALSCGTPLLLAPAFCAPAFCWWARGGPFERIRSNQAARCFTEAGRVASETAVQDLTSVEEQLKAVGDLLRLRRAQNRARAIVATAVATDDLHPGMLAHPLGEGNVRPLRQQIDDLASFEVEQQGSIGRPAPDSKIIHAAGVDDVW